MMLWSQAWPLTLHSRQNARPQGWHQNIALAQPQSLKFLQHCGPAGRWNHSNSSVSPEHRILITIKIGKNKKKSKEKCIHIDFFENKINWKMAGKEYQKSKRKIIFKKKRKKLANIQRRGKILNPTMRSRCESRGFLWAASDLFPPLQKLQLKPFFKGLSFLT